MGICAAFLDGGYLEKVIQHDHDRASIDYEKLVAAMTGNEHLLRAYYYNCLPFQGEHPTQEERDRYSGKRRFYDALERLPRFDVKLGRLTLLGYSDEGRPIVQQKRVDIMLATDMVNLAIKGRVNSISLFTGDSDLIPAVEHAKNEGVRITLWHGSLSNDSTAPSRDLYKLADERVHLSGQTVNEIRRELHEATSR